MGRGKTAYLIWRKPAGWKKKLRRRRPRRRRQPPPPLRLRPSAPGTPLPIPSAARRSVPASSAVPTGDLARRCTPLRCLRQAQCLPLPHTCLPHLPTFPHRLYTPLHTSTAPPHRAYPTRRRHQTRASPIYPTAPLPPRPHPKPPPPDAQPHRAAPPHAVPRGTRRSIQQRPSLPPYHLPLPARGLPDLTEPHHHCISLIYQ